MVASGTLAVSVAPQDIDSHSATTSGLNVDVQHLTTSKGIALEDPPMGGVFESVVAILTLIRNQDSMLGECPFGELAELCARTCRVLEATDDLAGIDETIESLGRTVRRIESGIRQRGDCARDLREHNLDCVIAWREELCEILRVLGGGSGRGSALELSGIHEYVHNPFHLEPDSAPALVTPTRSGVPVVVDPGIPLYQHSGDANHDSEPPSTLASGKRALQRLVSDIVPYDELPSLIEAVVANVKLRDIAKCLERSDDAQKFIDVMDQALETIDFAPRVRNKCVKSLYKMCARHTLLPSSLRFELPGGPMGEVKYRCGSADVLKRECGGREVAIKALWPRSDLSLETMTNRFCKEVITWKSLRHPNILPLQGATMTGNRFAMVSEWMTNGNIKEYTAAHQDTNRFALLVDVAKGLIHMHGRGMIHGDLKGANILVDRDGRACLADFGLLTIASDATNTPSSNSFLEGGTCRWMGPELFNPEKFGLKDGRPTRSSDCYALGMVVYEVLSGRVPFHRYGDYAVVAKVSEGERPERPQGARGAFFGNDIWNLLQSCWMPSPGNRPKIKDVLRRLEDVSRSWTPPPQTITDLPIETAATWEPESSTEESIDGCGFSSTSEMNSPQLSQRHSLEAPSYHVLGAAVRSPGGSGRSTQSLDGQPSSGSQSMETLLRRRSTCTCQEALPQCHTLDEFQAIGAEGCEWQDRALRVFTEKGCHGDLAMRKTRESPGGAEHLRALVQTMLEWMDVQKALNAMPFYYY